MTPVGPRLAELARALPRMVWKAAPGAVTHHICQWVIISLPVCRLDQDGWSTPTTACFRIAIQELARLAGDIARVRDMQTGNETEDLSFMWPDPPTVREPA